MKIGFDAKRLFCNQRGLGNYSRTLVGILQREFPEHEYHLYTPKMRTNIADFEYFTSDAFCVHQPEHKNFLWRSFLMHSQIKKDSIDIYHGLSHELPHFLDRKRTKTVVTIHDLIFLANKASSTYINRYLYNSKAKHSCLNADRIIAISENTKRDIVHYYDVDPSRIDVVYQSCNPIFYNPRSEIQNQEVLKRLGISFDYFLFVGGAEQNKNLKLVIDAYRLLPQDLRIPLLVVGRGRKKSVEEAKQLISAYKLDSYFVWMDNLSSNLDLQSLYQCSRGLIFPSLYEGFGLPLLEALLSSTPVLSSNSSSLTEAGGPSSLYFNPTAVEELVHTIEKVLSDDELAQRMRREGLAYAHENFMPEHFGQNVMKSYKRVLESD